MSNEHAPLLDILAEASGEADYRAVYAELMATNRGRSFLSEFASRNLQPDTRKLVRMVARLEAVVRDNRRPEIPVAVLRGLADLAATIDQCEAELAASCVAQLEEPRVLQHIGDITLALRKRKVEPLLCDTIGAVAREVGNVIARDDAARDAVQSAVTLVQQLSRRVREIIALAAADGSAAAPGQDGLMEAIFAGDESGTEATDVRSHTIRAESSESLQGDAPQPESPQTVAFSEDAAQPPAEQLSINAQQPRIGEARNVDDSEWFDDTDRESEIDAASKLSTDANRIEAALATIPLPELLPDREADVAQVEAAGKEDRNDLLRPLSLALTPSPPEKLPGTLRAALFSRQRASATTFQKSTSRTAPRDPLAAVLALSEEELIALFT